MKHTFLRWQHRLTRLTTAVGRLSAWLALFLVLGMVLVVALRYAFGIGNIALQESLTYLHGALFMLAIAYTLAEDEHVRVDVLYQRFSPRTRAWVNLLGTLFLLMPLCAALFWLSLDYVASSWREQEGSANGGLLPPRQGDLNPNRLRSWTPWRPNRLATTSARTGRNPQPPPFP